MSIDNFQKDEVVICENKKLAESVAVASGVFPSIPKREGKNRCCFAFYQNHATHWIVFRKCYNMEVYPWDGYIFHALPKSKFDFNAAMNYMEKFTSLNLRDDRPKSTTTIYPTDPNNN